jgi:hypothetical protein
VATNTAPEHPFRQHDSVQGMRSPFLRQLCEEWVELNASSHVSDDLARWALDHPVLEGLSTPGDVVDRIDQAPKAGKDAVLRALLALYLQGEQLAGRILVQQMLPCITDLVRRCLPPRGVTSYEENIQRAIVEFWDVISRPRELPGPGVAGRLWLDTLKQLTSHRRSHDAWEAHTTYEDDQSVHNQQLHLTATDRPVVDEYDPEADLLDLLVAARSDGTLSDAEVKFLVDVYLSPGRTLSEAADRLGLTPAAVRKRCSRLKGRLVDAVLASDAPLTAVARHG